MLKTIIAILLTTIIYTPYSMALADDRTTQLLSANNVCYRLIKELSAYDRTLGNRSDSKRQAAIAAATAHDFVTTLLNTKETGTSYACGSTRAWVTEVFEGLGSQYTEFKNDPDGIDGSKAGYTSVNGEQMIAQFTANIDSKNSIIYHLRHTGTEDHVFTVEQFPYGMGYRIYQSYHDAYSLYAWLADSTDGLYDTNNGEIMIWKALPATVNDYLMKQIGGVVSLNNLKYLPKSHESYRSYLEYVRDYDKTIVMTNFTAAWRKYGKGKILSKDAFFNDYLAKTAKLIDYFIKNDTTANPRSPEIGETWIALYGAANSIHFPNYPNNFITNRLFPERVYRMEIMSVPLPANQISVVASCVANARIIKKALGLVKIKEKKYEKSFINSDDDIFADIGTQCHSQND